MSILRVFCRMYRWVFREVWATALLQWPNGSMSAATPRFRSMPIFAKGLARAIIWKKYRAAKRPVYPFERAPKILWHTLEVDIQPCF